MTWFIWAVFSSFCAAALAESNRIFKLDASLLNAWRSTFGVALMAAALPNMHWPDNSGFYSVAVLDGVVSAIGMALFFYLAAKRTGRVSSMILPLSAFGAYVTWWMMEPALRPDFMESPFRVLLAVSSFVLVCISFQKVRDNDASWESFVIVLPVGIAFGVIDAMTKGVLGDNYNVYATALAYTFLSLVICAGVSWVITLRKPLGGRTTGVFDRKLLWGGFWCGFWTVGMMLASVFSLSAAPNPSLTGLVMALTPLWLFALNYFRRVEDAVSIPASLLIIAGAAGLLLSTI
jgi:hypothetical protein